MDKATNMNKLKDFLSVFKDGLLLCLFLLLIFFPSYFNKMLERAGFTEGSLMGFSWKQKAIQSKEVANSSQKLAINAGIRMEEMQERMDSISKKLETLAATANDPAVDSITKAINSSKAQLKFSNKELTKEVQFQNKKLDYIFKDAPVITPKN